MEPEKDSNAWVRVPKDEYKEWKRHQKDQGGQGQGQPIPGVPPAEGGAAQTTPQEQPQTEVKQQEQPQTQPEQQQAPTGGYGGQQQPAEAAPTESDDPRKQKKEGIDIGKLHISVSSTVHSIFPHPQLITFPISLRTMRSKSEAVSSAQPPQSAWALSAGTNIKTPKKRKPKPNGATTTGNKTPVFAKANTSKQSSKTSPFLPLRGS